MKQYIVIALGFLLGPLANAQPNKAVEYRFEVIPSGAATYSWYYKSPTLLTTSSNMVFGSGLNGLTGFRRGPSAIPDTAMWADSWSSTFDATDYFGWTMTPPPLNILVIDSITWRKRMSGTGPRFQSLRSNANMDNFTTNIWVSPNDPSTGWVKRSVTSNLPSSPSALTIRMYGFGSTGAGGTIRIDTLRVFAHLISTLPIELLTFTGEAQERDIRLDWSTATETNNDHFTVYRLESDSTWNEVGRVVGAGNSVSTREYSLLDPEPEPGLNYYLLRQTDIDGAFEDSPMISVIWKPPDKIVVFPNPPDRYGPVSITGTFTSVTVSNGVGQIVPSSVSGNEVRFPSEAGTYFLLIDTPYGNRETITVVRH